ncbi:MAG TPA: MmcQ/YjbR family DNA-binding protein [Solirubrobacteraceae bacterium]
MPTWDDVVEIGTRLPGVEVGTSFRTPALRVRGKGMCRLRSNPDALVLRVADMGEREALLQGQPDVFFSTPHYDGYPYVLVRLKLVDQTELGELLEEAWRVFAAKRVVKAYDAERGG